MHLFSAKIFFLIAAANGLLAVCLGAFGSHGLRDKLPENLMQAWTTAVSYHFYHLLAVFAVGLLLQQGLHSRFIQSAGYVFSLGLVLFCGSLYLLALGGPRWLGPITPLGGLCFIAGWALLFIGILKWKQ